MNGMRYRHMFNIFLFRKMRDLNNNISWFQQGGAKCHITTETINLSKGDFSDYVLFQEMVLSIGLQDRVI